MNAVRVLLCDADDCLFPSEAPAFEASTRVTNSLLADLGVDHRFEPDELRRRAAGKNFRATAIDLARSFGADLDERELDARVEEERQAVSAHLERTLRPDPRVLEPVTRLGERFGLAVVSSSAASRLRVCFRATGLDGLFPEEVRFSAIDSLPAPTSKPDPAVYELAGQRLGIAPEEGLAVEDSVSGVRSAVGAGFTAVGNVLFVPEGEREERAELLLRAGAAAVVSSWQEIEAMLEPSAAAVQFSG